MQNYQGADDARTTSHVHMASDTYTVDDARTTGHVRMAGDTYMAGNVRTASDARTAGDIRIAGSADQCGVVFDCDGVLIDSMQAWYEVEHMLAEQAGVSLSEEDTKNIAPLTIPEVGMYFFDRFALGKNPGEVTAMIEAAMLDFYGNRAKPRPGALHFVEQLVRMGVRISVASTTPQKCLQAGLTHTGFMPHLQAIVSVDDVGVSKREPLVYDRACELSGVDQNKVWVVEDSLYALLTLRHAGYKTIGIYDQDIAGTYENLQGVADIAVRSFDELTAGMLFSDQ